MLMFLLTSCHSWTKPCAKLVQPFHSRVSLVYVIVNDQPTRVTSSTSTLIDLVITNNSSLIKSSRAVELEISDHMLTHSSIHIRNKPVRTYRNLNLADFQRDVASAP